MEQEHKHILPAEIEKTSMRLIAEELSRRGVSLLPETEAVVKRVIHTTADFDYVENLKFTPHAVQRAVEALRSGAVIITDTNMAKSGISRAGLQKLNCEAYCFMADSDVGKAAKEKGTTRAAISMQKAAKEYPHAVLAVGNAPTALLELCGLIQDGLRPPLVVGVPVGFVNVEESKRRIFEVCQSYGIACIAAMGRKGGSNVAAAICNALLYTALDALDPSRRPARLE